MTVRPALTRNYRALLLGALFGLAALCGCARSPTVGSIVVPPIPAGEARIWFYRVYLPSETLNMTKVTMNGVYAGYAQLGGAFYRDVPPGTYHVEVESYGRDFNQSTNVALVPGQEAYVKIESLRQLVDDRRGRFCRQAGHVLRAADFSSDRPCRDRAKLFRRRQLTIPSQSNSRSNRQLSFRASGQSPVAADALWLP